MIGRLALLATLAVAFVTAETINDDYLLQNVADKEYLHKQKAVYDVLYHYTQPQLNKELYEVGQKYNLEANIESYHDKEAVKSFLKHYEHYGILPHDAIYSVYYYPEETLVVYKILYSAKDFETFYNTALYMRNRVNHDLFAYTFYLAVIHRPDTEYVRLPPLYEVIPYMFYNSELMEQAHHAEYFGTKETNNSGYETYVIPYNYSGHYLNDEYNYDYENLVNYLTEDIGWNEYYFYYRSEYPYLLNTEEFGLYNKYRGEEYLYGHKQILTRYNLERLVNGLGRVEHFDYHGEFYPGYYPTLTYPNGLPFPVRPWNAYFPKNKQHDITYGMQYESRLLDAVDSGYVLAKDGKKVDIYTPEGLNILGNLIEGNADSYNTQYYGKVDILIRHILGFNNEPASHYQAHPSALEQLATSMRDPAFYRLYVKILHFYHKYQENQGPYKPEEIQFPELQIQKVEVDKLQTYFESFDSTISHGLVASSKQVADNVHIKARQYRLNHKDFSVNVTINADHATKAAVKIYIGPKYDVHGRELEFSNYYYDYFYEIDSFVADLTAGVNHVSRVNMDFTGVDNESTEKYYSRVVKAIETGEEFKYEKRIYGFPTRLLLPKGKPEGMPMQMFVYVAPVEGEPLRYSSRIFGESYVDNRPFGFPLNRPVIDHDFHAPNMYFEEVRIYHRA